MSGYYNVPVCFHTFTLQISILKELGFLESIVAINSIQEYNFRSKYGVFRIVQRVTDLHGDCALGQQSE